MINLVAHFAVTLENERRETRKVAKSIGTATEDSQRV